MPKGKTMRAALAFTPSESKRLIAKGVAAMPEVRSALSEGEIVVAPPEFGCVLQDILEEQKTIRGLEQRSKAQIDF